MFTVSPVSCGVSELLCGPFAMFLGSFAVFRSSFAVFSITPFTAPWRQPASVVYRLPVPVLLRLLSLHHYTVTCRHELQIIQKSNGLFIVPRPTTYKNFKPNSTILSIPYHTNFWVILVTDRQTDRQMTIQVMQNIVITLLCWCTVLIYKSIAIFFTLLDLR